jgi:hypothetical protein
MVPQKLEIIRGLESGMSHRVVMASYNIGSVTQRHRQTEGPVMIVHGIYWKCEGPCQALDIGMASFSTVG